MNKTERVLLKIAGASSILIGSYHFLLPYQWKWGPFLNQLPGMIEWAVSAINFFMSFLLVLFGIFTWRTIHLIKHNHPTDLNVLMIGALFWTQDFLYLSFNPPPIPGRLWFIEASFMGSAFITAAFYIIPLYRFYQRKLKSK
jgi:hypothetical protein